MSRELQAAVRRYTVFAQEVLQPAIYDSAVPLEAAVWQSPEPVTFDVARAAAYLPVTPPWHWGPVWSTAWFRLRGQVPTTHRGQSVALRFSSGTEALLWRDGVPHQAFDQNRDALVLWQPAQGGDSVEAYIEAACNHAWGIVSYAAPADGATARWNTNTPGHLSRAELAVYHEDVWRLWVEYEFARQLLAKFDENTPRAHEIDTALRRATQLVRDDDVAGTAADARTVLGELFTAHGSTPASRAIATGHAHIDTAWLWPLREARRKCQRSFSNVLRLMERYPQFTFLCSQAQQYAWIEQDAPGLFAQIAARAAEGRWEPGGAMWVEPDCSAPSGESLVRQVLHGTRFWEARFGPAGRQSFIFLPDTFGFPPVLPQIMAGAGLQTFITNKLSWNDSNEFPLGAFRWRGLDGTEVLAHCTPAWDYNSQNTVEELQRGERNYARLDRGRTRLWLHPFGFGDGGGGPTAEMIERAGLARGSVGLPAVELGTTTRFCDELRQRRAALRAAGQDLPVWDGELYLEMHRGTYSTHGWLKRANCVAEQALRMGEWLAFAGPAAMAPAAASAWRSRLDTTWKLLLLNQFHDILPGSSITWVYEDARRDHATIRAACDELHAAGTAGWKMGFDTHGVDDPLLVFNPTSQTRSGVVSTGDTELFVTAVPALGARIVSRSAAWPPDVAPATVMGRTLENHLLRATFDEEGRITALVCKSTGRDLCAVDASGRPQPLNQLALYEDRPRDWEAWDIDATYREKPVPLGGPVDRCEVLSAGPLRAILEISRPLGAASRITQRFILSAGSPRLDIETEVDWQEDRRLLRADFPVGVRARRATYGTQFGHQERPTHENTSWERAMFEVPAHHWADLSEPGAGLALLDNGRFGHSCHGHVLGLTLLRSPRAPDPEADRGRNIFTYSLMPHTGDWRAAGVLAEAAALNAPLHATPLPSDQSGPLREAWAPFTLELLGAVAVEVTALKPSEVDDRLILRLVELHGGRGAVRVHWHLPVTAVSPVDLLERPCEWSGCEHHHATGTTVVPLRPFQIVTLAVTRA